MSILYPDVPDAPGVPTVLRDPSNTYTDTASPLTSDSADASTTASEREWGIYDQVGNKVLDPDSVFSIEYGKEEQISTYPTENGGFQSYNKVETPYSIRLIVNKGGPLDKRTAFLADCDQLRASIDLYTIVTPEKIYDNANVTRVGQVRNAQNGAQLMTVEMKVDEVRTSAVSTFTKYKDPSSADPVSAGPVQTQPATAAQTPKGPPS